jgi:hypothetical protein
MVEDGGDRLSAAERWRLEGVEDKLSVKARGLGRSGSGAVVYCGDGSASPTSLRLSQRNRRFI